MAGPAAYAEVLPVDADPHEAAPPAAEAPAPAEAVPLPAPAAVEPDAAAVPAVASQAPDTLAGVLTKVWRDNPQVLRAQSGLLAAGFEITAARTGYFPYAQIGTSIGETSEESVSTLRVVQPLWRGGRTSAEVDGAKARERAAIAELARTRLELGARTVEAFLNVAAAQEQTLQWDVYVTALEHLLSVITRRADKGAAPQADVQTALSRLRQAEAGRAANRSLLETNRAQLASLVNSIPPPARWPDEPYMLTDQEIETALARADLHPQRLLAAAQMEAQEGTMRTARASLWPELSVQFRQQLEGTQFDPSNDATLLVLQYQTSDGVRGAFGYQAEKQRVEEARAQLNAAIREVEATLHSDRAQLAAVSRQLGFQVQATESAESLVSSFLRQFEVGRRSWIEVLNAQREANEAVLQSIAVKRSYWVANCKLALDAMYWHRLGASVSIQTDTKKP